MKRLGGRQYALWDEKDGFFYDTLRYPNGEFHKFRLRSLVGLIPLYAVEILEHEDLADFPTFLSNIEWFVSNRADLIGDACYKLDDAKKARRRVHGPAGAQRHDLHSVQGRHQPQRD